MSAHSKIHQANLDDWTVLIAEQAASGLTIRAWCEQNNISFHKYNYWKHLLKESVTDKVFPDIVPITVPNNASTLQTSSHELHESCDLYNSSNYIEPVKHGIPITITINDIRIDISAENVSLLNDIIKVVRYA